MNMNKLNSKTAQCATEKPNDLALAQMGRKEDTGIKESAPAPSVASSALFSSVFKTSPELQGFEGSEVQQSSHTGSKESDSRSQHKQTNRQQRDCRTNDENSQEESQSDCSLGRDFSPESNIRSASQEVGLASVSQQHEENQKPYYHGHLNSISGSGQENANVLNQSEYQKDDVQLAESVSPPYQQYSPTHIGLIDVSPYPNPHNEKTKIALVGGYLRRVPLSHPEPESANNCGQMDGRREYKILDGAVSYSASEEENEIAQAPPAPEVNETSPASAGGCLPRSCSALSKDPDTWCYTAPYGEMTMATIQMFLQYYRDKYQDRFRVSVVLEPIAPVAEMPNQS